MKRLRWLTCGLVLLAVSAGPALAQDADEGAEKPRKRARRDKKDRPERKRRPRKRGSALRGQWALMVKELELTDEQKAKVEEILKAQAEARTAWKKDKGAQYRELAQAMAEARKDKNAEAAKELSEQIAELRKEQEAIAAKEKADVMAILTPEQKANWPRARFTSQLLTVFARARLTGEQQAKVRALAKDAWEMLTDEQRAAMQRTGRAKAKRRGRDSKPKRDRKPRGPRKAKPE